MTTYHLASRPHRVSEPQLSAPDLARPSGSTTEQSLLLDIPAAAGFAGMKERAMRHLFTQRVFPVVALGTRLYVRRADLLKYFDLHTRPARSVAE
jgi:hypothetical protein